MTPSGNLNEPGQNLDKLPKAHLHLHFTGSLSVTALQALAHDEGTGLSEQLVDTTPLLVPGTVRGWFRFQRAYNGARRAVRSEAAMRAVIRNAARCDAAEGSRRLEIQIDPTSYAPYVDGIVNALEIVQDEAIRATIETGVQVALVVAASRLRHPMEARTLARLAAKYAGHGPGDVVGFGLSNNEREGDTEQWAGAFKIARNAGLPGVPHAGELRGPDHIRQVVATLQPQRLGHGVRSADDPALLDFLVASGIALEVCPASNVALGIYDDVRGVPLRTLVNAGATVALGADDPLLFGARLTDQYRIAATLGFTDTELAALAKSSITASFASDTDKSRWLVEVDEWLAAGIPGRPERERIEL